MNLFPIQTLSISLEFVRSMLAFEYNRTSALMNSELLQATGYAVNTCTSVLLLEYNKSHQPKQACRGVFPGSGEAFA